MFLVCHQIKGDWIKPGAAVIDVGHIVSAAAEQDVMVCTLMQLPYHNKILIVLVQTISQCLLTTESLALCALFLAVLRSTATEI